VILHLIDVSADWELEKRVIRLRLINIAEPIEFVVSEFSLKDKIFSVTLDNASSNTSAISNLIPMFVGYLGSDPELVDNAPDRDIGRALRGVTQSVYLSYYKSHCQVWFKEDQDLS
jgi:hypothetical protein